MTVASFGFVVIKQLSIDHGWCQDRVVIFLERSLSRAVFSGSSSPH